MIRIAKKLKEITPNAIFATTTPTRPTYTYTRNERIDRYNELIVPKLLELGIYINDLNILLKGKENEMICDDEIHLSEKGVEVCADAVYKAIKKFI
jgi:lysophospholipase L1-like esterase